MSDKKDNKEARSQQPDPITYMRSRHPDLYSDSKTVSRPQLTEDILEYRLQTLTNRNQETEFAHFARSHRVIRYDARGFGRSERPDLEYSHSTDLRTLLDALGITRAALVGLSLGGRTAHLPRDTRRFEEITRGDVRLEVSAAYDGMDIVL